MALSKIPEEKIDEIRSSTNIVHYISQYLTLQKDGQNFKALCPFHSEKTPSFKINPEKQIFHCFGCGKGGNVFSFIMEYEHLSFPESLKQAADFSGIEIAFEEKDEEAENYFQKLYDINEKACRFLEEMLHKPQNKTKLNYFKDRHLSLETIQSFRLGFAPDSYDKLLLFLKQENVDLNEAQKLGLIQNKKNETGFYSKFRYRVMFPFMNNTGKIIGFGGRKLRDEQQPKYLNSPESPVYKKGQILYGLHLAIHAIRQNDYAIVVEGYFDLLRLFESGIKNVVASSGTALTDNQAKLLRRYTKNVYISYDGDPAGVKAAIRNAYILENNNLNAFIIPLPENDDPDTFILKNSISAYHALLSKKEQPLNFEINSFFGVNENPSLDKKNSFINEVLANLINQPDAVKTGLYLHLLADRLQINEGLIIDQYNRYKRARLKRNRQNTISKEEPIKDSTEFSGIYTGQFKAEEGLIKLLISQSKDIRNMIIETVRHELFENDDFITLYEYMIEEFEETGNINISKMIENFQHKERLTQIISDAALFKTANPEKFSRDCIYQLEIWQLQKQSQELSAIIKVESKSIETVLHYTSELTGIRRKIDALQKEMRIYRK